MTATIACINAAHGVQLHVPDSAAPTTAAPAFAASPAGATETILPSGEPMEDIRYAADGEDIGRAPDSGAVLALGTVEGGASSYEEDDEESGPFDPHSVLTVYRRRCGGTPCSRAATSMSAASALEEIAEEGCGALGDGLLQRGLITPAERWALPHGDSSAALAASLMEDSDAWRAASSVAYAREPGRDRDDALLEVAQRLEALGVGSGSGDTDGLAEQMAEKYRRQVAEA